MSLGRLCASFLPGRLLTFLKPKTLAQEVIFYHTTGIKKLLFPYADMPDLLAFDFGYKIGFVGLGLSPLIDKKPKNKLNAFKKVIGSRNLTRDNVLGLDETQDETDISRYNI